MTNSENSHTLGPEVAKLTCRTRYATGCDMGHIALGFYMAPPLLGLILTIFLGGVQHETDVLTNMGLAKYTSAVYIFTFFAVTVALYSFCFSAPNIPITIHENGIQYRNRKLPFEDILGVRVGSGEVADADFKLTLMPMGRIQNAINMAEQAHQTAINSSIFLVTRNGEVAISKGLALYEQEDLEQLIAAINENGPEPVGVTVPSYA